MRDEWFRVRPTGNPAAAPHPGMPTGTLNTELFERVGTEVADLLIHHVTLSSWVEESVFWKVVFVGHCSTHCYLATDTPVQSKQ